MKLLKSVSLTKTQKEKNKKFLILVFFVIFRLQLFPPFASYFSFFPGLMDHSSRGFPLWVHHFPKRTSKGGYNTSKPQHVNQVQPSCPHALIIKVIMIIQHLEQSLAYV